MKGAHVFDIEPSQERAMAAEHLFTTEKKITQRLKSLISVNQSFAEIESLEELFPRMLQLAKQVTEAEAASLLLYNPEEQILEFVSIDDETLQSDGIRALKEDIKIKIGKGIAGWVAQQRQSLIIEDAQNDPRFLTVVDKKTGFTTRNILSVPLLYHEELLGVLNVLNAKHRQNFDSEDEQILLSYAYLASAAIVRAKLIATRLEQQRLEIQLTAASTIQSMFQPEPPTLGSGSHAWAISLPAAFVGGDLYDFLPMGDGSWVIYVADVSDKGLPAAMVMASLWSQIRAEIPFFDDIERLLETVNRSMHELLSAEGFFATIILGRYWPKDGRLTLVRGGHLPPLHVSNGKLQSVPELHGASLGISERIKFVKKEIILSPGDSILFISDGVTESQNGKGELFGTARLMRMLEGDQRHPLGPQLLAEIRDWQGASPQSDDLTILEIWRN